MLLVMSQPDYPIFSKRHQKAQRTRRGTYNFEKTKEYELAEKWFEERREAKQERPPSPMVQSPPPTIKQPSKSIFGPPPGLPKPITTKACNKCKVPQRFPVILNCCQSVFCLDCVVFESNLYNRCHSCKKVIDITKYDEYDGLNLKIPSFEDFDYKESEDPVLVTYIPLNDPVSIEQTLTLFDNKYSTPPFSEVANSLPDSETKLSGLDGQNLTNVIMTNYQIYLQWQILNSLLSGFL